MDEIFDNLLVGIPETTANLQLPDPDLRDYYRDEAERVFWLDNQIDDNTMDLVKMIMRCNKEDKGKDVSDRTPIKIFISSPGGDVQVLYTLIKAIEISKTPCYTINYCTAYSAAADLMTCGHKRYALPGTSFMMHNGSCMYGGTQDQVASTKTFFDSLTKKITEFVLAKTTIPAKTYKKKAVSDWFFDEEEALSMGVIDKVISNFDEIM